MKKEFDPKLEKKTFKCGKEYWLSDRESAAVDGLPVYSRREISLMLSIKDRLTQNDLDNFYNIKLTTGSTMHEIIIDLNRENEKDLWEDQYKKNGNKLNPTAEIALKDIYKKLGRNIE